MDTTVASAGMSFTADTENPLATGHTGRSSMSLLHVWTRRTRVRLTLFEPGIWVNVCAVFGQPCLEGRDVVRLSHFRSS